MNKLKKLAVYVVIIALMFCFIVHKAIKTSEKISMVSESAIEYAQNLYEGKKFEMVSWNYHRHDQSYTVTLMNTENKTTLLYCEVSPTFQKDKSYHVKIYGGRNIELIE